MGENAISKPAEDHSKLSGSSNKVLIGLEWAALLAGIGLLTITEVFRAYIWLGIILVGISFLLRVVRKRQLVPNTGLEIPWLLFIGSAALATWIAYDRSLAFLQFTRILAAFTLFYAICDSQLPLWRWLCAGFLTAAVVLAIYWPLQHDFSLDAPKMTFISGIGMWINSHLPSMKFESLTGPSIHPSVAAGTLVLAIPFGIALTWERAKARSSIQAIMAGLATFLILAGLLLTKTRGAFLGLAIAFAVAVLVWMQRRWLDDARSKQIFWGIIGSVLLVCLILIFVSGNLNGLVGQIPDPTGTLQYRTSLWQQALGLIRDYPFTGSGLMTFFWVHSTYALLIHAPFIQHAHNTLLEVWIEQGILGVISLVWMMIIVAAWAWRALSRRDFSVFGWAGLASLVIVATQGIYDVVFYIERTLPLIGLALGYAWIATDPNPPLANTSARPFAWRKWIAAGVTIAAIIGIILFRHPLASAWYANAGAVSQTYQELSRYTSAPHDFQSLDLMRRSTNLDEAEASFNQALALDSANITSLQRLSQIALSRGDYSLALTYMEVAWNAGHQDDVTLLLYGDALVANGQPPQAAAVVRGLTWAEARLMGQGYSRYWQQGDFERAAHAFQAVLYLNPDNQGAAEWLLKAQSKMEP